ncbi:hypothetical protein PR001_g12341 [Phytophthora rubi]|uniref:Uncharacterized protein n=1 Tax=Phytophthora rubi TaxID=129364 RepID=A0A6A3LKJ3_9STRA|nr:hypothetical protein PR002_g12673 [Phytophthora rubi]KAE9025779.1 hypothetical protein PR001_g12341 [Phytophthora rubi]
MKSGSKRLLDLGRSNRGLTYTAGEEISEKNNPTECRRPTQVNIDGMLVVRKDQARILEQTLQLLFSCEVLVVPSSSRFLFLSCWVYCLPHFGLCQALATVFSFVVFLARR